MRCPHCSSRVTVLASQAAGAPALPAAVGGGGEGDGGKVPMFCPACQSSFVLDERAALVSARDRARVVARPEGVVIVEGGASGGPVYRSAHRDADVRLGVFAPSFGKLGPIVAAVVCCYATITLMRVLRDRPWADYLPLGGVVAFYVIVYVGFRVWPRLRGASHELRLSRDVVVALEHGREVLRCSREELVRVLCAGEPNLHRGKREPAIRYSLAAFDRAGRRHLLWEDVSSQHGTFAELWLEEQLGLEGSAEGGDAESGAERGGPARG